MLFRCFIWALMLVCMGCHGRLVPSQISSQAFPSYCDVLHVPNGDSVIIEKKPFLGIRMRIADKEELSVDECDHHVQIDAVIKGTPAYQADLKKNDIILSANGNSFCAPEARDTLKGFRQFIVKQKVNSPVTLDILRGKERFSVTAELTERPYQEQEEAEHEDIGRCFGQLSLFERELSIRDQVPLLNTLLSELRYRSNFVHNPSWLSRKNANPYQLKEFTYMLRHPLQNGIIAHQITEPITNISRQSNWRMSDMMNRLSLLLDMDDTQAVCSDLTLEKLTAIMEQTNRHVHNALQNVTPEERELLREKVIKPWDDDQWNKVVEMSLRIEHRKLIHAFYPLLSCLTGSNLALLQKSLNVIFGNTGDPIVYETESSFGKIIVGGTGVNIYREDAALILDLGGDDIYLNNAGGTRNDIPVAVLIDWEGDDHYMSRERFSQGAGLLGGGFLIDLGGKDLFDALDGSQGAGLFGIGVLFNAGERTTLKARSFCQGIGQLGIGLIWNKDAESLYDCSEYGQGLGFFRGVGMVLDENSDDYYLLGGLSPDFRDPSRSTVSMGQGFGKGVRADENIDGISGGIGILMDQAGNDVYIADYFAQGSSYYSGVGILQDRSGNDTYLAGRYAQGAGIHSSVGVLIDQRGNDFYHASFGVGQGMGHDYGVGFLQDMQGNDRYSADILSQGAATIGGIGIILDLKGRDLYTVKRDGQAYARDESGMGVMIDLEPFKDSASSHTDARPVRIGVKSQ